MKSNFFNHPVANIYSKPSSNSEVSSQILYGEKFKILSKNKNWLKIKISFDNYVGYLKDSQYIEKHNPNYKVSNLKAKIFKKPGNGTKIWLPLGSKLSVIEENKNYIKIEKNKWIKKSDIKKFRLLLIPIS